MFPSRINGRSLSLRAPHADGLRRRQAWLSLRAFVGASVVLWTLTAAGAAEPLPEPVRESEEVKARGTKGHSLVLGLRYGNPQDAVRLYERTHKLLTLISCFDEFDCRLAGEMLMCERSAELVTDGPFVDALLGLRVRGDAHVEGTLRMVPVENANRAAIDVHIEGTARMRGVGQSHGVRIDSDATTRFHVTKRVFVDHTGATMEPSICQTTTALKITGIKARQPRLIGRFAERIAEHRVSDSQVEAEAECSAHVADAICAAVDREVGALTAAINKALAEHLAAASESHKAKWRRLQFRSAEDCIFATRDSQQKSLFSPWPAAGDNPPSPIIVRLPRWGLDLRPLLAGLNVLAGSGATGATAATEPAPESFAFRPKVSWQETTVTLTMDRSPATRLALEPALGVAQ